MRIILVVAIMFFSSIAQGATNQRRLTLAEIKAITVAVEDEIYDYDYYRAFSGVGTNAGTPQHWIARVNIYINPSYNTADGYGEVIYKLMPIGQIYRLCYLDATGQVQLDGDPQNHFPITQPSHQTVFMDKSEVRDDERTWTRELFTVDTEPSTNAIAEASRRQKLRTGFSDWEYKRSSKHSDLKP